MVSMRLVGKSKIADNKPGDTPHLQNAGKPA
jgi:hypothetical protein